MDDISHYAIKGDLQKLRECLSSGVDTIQNDYHDTALICASRNGKINVIEYLVSKGADLNIQNVYGDTALHWASMRGDLDMVKCLVKAGANINIQNKYEITPLKWARCRGRLDVVEYLKIFG